MNPLDSSLPVSSIQSQIGAVEVRIEGVQAQIAEVAESVKAVQSQVVEVSAKIETTKIDLKQAKLLPDDREILMLDLKRLMDKEKSLMDKEKSLMDKEKSLMDKEKSLMDEKKILSGELSTTQFTREADFSVVWSAILNDKIIESPENPRLWSLPDGVDWIGGVKELYNRACYDEITKIAFSKKRVLVRGTPGIGKSLFLQVFLVHLARQAKREGRSPPTISYVYTTENDKVVKLSFLPDGSVVDITNVALGTFPDYELSDSVDLNMPYGKTLSLLVASDKEANYNSFRKRIKEAQAQNRGKSYIMPLFSFEELRVLKPDLDKRVAQFRHDVFGGSARCFIANDTDTNFMQPIVGAILSFLFPDIKATYFDDWDLVGRLVSSELEGKTTGIAVATVNSMMWHLRPDGSKDWASKMMQMLAGEICETRELAIATALEQMVGTSGIGNAFECLGHRKLVQCAQPVLLKPLLEKLPDERPVFETAQFNLPVIAFRSVEEISNLPNGTYGLPMTPNFPVSDAVVQPDTLLQYTTSLKHKGSVENLDLQRAQLTEKDRSKHKFVFVVPKKNVRDFRYQANLGDIRQFICLSEPSAVNPVTLMSAAEKEKWIPTNVGGDGNKVSSKKKVSG